MTHKEIAERLRKVAFYGARTNSAVEELQAMANELDPPRPARGTVVWWRYWQDESDLEWRLGQVQEDGLLYPFGSDRAKAWEIIEWKPARILGPDEVAVNVPPVSEWDYDAERITVRRTITRAEAEAMEAEHE